VKHTNSRRPTRNPARAAASKPGDQYLLRLYVAGTSSRSRQAILRARELCAAELKGRCKLEVIDIYQDPIRARNGQIVATPTLVKELPRPVRRLIGTLAKSSRLFVGLGLDTPGQLAP
jgi:circadian clock protein KaiB